MLQSDLFYLNFEYLCGVYARRVMVSHYKLQPFKSPVIFFGKTLILGWFKNRILEFEKQLLHQECIN